MWQARAGSLIRGDSAMMAFDHVFWEVAKRDSRMIQTVDQAGLPATFVFREFYCTDPGCDCRRVVLHMHWVEQKRVAASINYAFEPSRRRDEPQISLDPLNPQSEHSKNLLALFKEMIAKDGEYRGRLLRHYTMWKEVVDDPSHPDHAKVRSTAHDERSFRPAFPRGNGAAAGARGAAGRGGAGRGTAARDMAGRGAAGRDAAGRGVPGARELDLVVARAARADSKLQQRFRRLLEKVARLRQRVRAWKEERPNIDREIAVYCALFEKQCGLGREVVSLLDRAYGDASLSKSERKTLAAVICSKAAELLEQGDDEELKAIYNRYSRGDFDAEAAEADAAGAEALRSMLEMFGVEFGDADVGSIEKLRAFSKEQLEAFAQDEAAAQERRAKRKKTAKQLASEARRADEERSAHKAVQDVYRALAKELHPDREQDPEERERKAELMREVNIAYEAKDLLRLLELQLQLERVDPTQVETVAEERVRHYNRILDEQSRQLAMEAGELELPFRLELGLSPAARLAPADVVARIRADSEVVRGRIASLARDVKAFEDVSWIKAWLKTQARSRGRGDRRTGIGSLHG
jgi:hypothetical protein